MRHTLAIIFTAVFISLHITFQEAFGQLVASPDNAAQWVNGTQDRQIIRQDIPMSVRWEHNRQSLLAIRNYPQDWTKDGNGLEFWMYSHKATQSAFILQIASENPQTDGPDYYYYTLKLSFTGWRLIRIPFNSFMISRTPLGWNRITGANFIASGWGHTPHPDAVVNFGPIRFATYKTGQGPRLTTQEFYNALNLDYHGLEDVKAAISHGDTRKADTALAAHFRTRQFPRWHVDWRSFSKAETRIPDFNTAEADKYASNHLVACGTWYQFGKDIDWSINPTPNQYAEWTWQLSRHYYWTVMGKAYWATGNEKYAKAFVSQLRSWIAKNPPPYDNGNYPFSRWRTLEAGLRASSTWACTFHDFLPSPAFDDDTLVLMLKSLYEHAIHLKMFPQSVNWLCTEMNGLFHIGVLFPEFKEAEEWRKLAADKLYDEMGKQVYPDGAQTELAPGYHCVSYDDFIDVYRLAALNGIALPGDYVQRLEKMVGMLLNVTAPNGTSPAVNDSVGIGTRDRCRDAVKLFPHRQDFLFWGTRGKEGVRPSFTSNFMPYAGWFTMRSNWDENALWLHFEAGPFGDGGHQHEDKLTFAIHAYGENLLDDIGNYAYDTSAWRQYAISARAHNVVRVDGQDQNRRQARRWNVVQAPLVNRWLTNPQYDFAEGVYDEGFGKGNKLTVTHSRAILYLKSAACWLMFDVMAPDDDREHEYTTWFHLHTQKARKLEKLNAFATDNSSRANLLIAPLNAAGLAAQDLSGQKTPEIQGWRPSSKGMVPIPTPTFVRRAKGLHVEPYLLYPVRPGQEIPVLDIKMTSDKSCQIRFQDGSRHDITFTAAGRYLDFLKWTESDSQNRIVSIIVIEQP